MAEVSKARAKALVQELCSAYASKSFQSKLDELLKEGGSQVTDDFPARWSWAEKVHDDILAQYGFGTGNGMKSLTEPLEVIVKSFPECMRMVQKIAEHLRLKQWPKKEEEVVESPGLSKNRALALQKELLAIFATPSFQKRLAELSRKKPAFKDVICQVFDDGAMDVVARWAALKAALMCVRYGFAATQQGVEDGRSDSVFFWGREQKPFLEEGDL